MPVCSNDGHARARQTEDQEQSVSARAHRARAPIAQALAALRGPAREPPPCRAGTYDELPSYARADKSRLAA